MIVSWGSGAIHVLVRLFLLGSFAEADESVVVDQHRGNLIVRQGAGATALLRSLRSVDDGERRKGSGVRVLIPGQGHGRPVHLRHRDLGRVRVTVVARVGSRVVELVGRHRLDG